MKNIINLLTNRPELYQESQNNIWSQPYVAKQMLKNHLNFNQDGATRHIQFVEASIEWIIKIIPPMNYPQLLDLGCGPGIYTERFYQEGYHVTGIDFSLNSIQYAQTSASHKQLDIHYFLGDYTNFKFQKQFDFITLIYCDFGVFSTQTRKELLRKIYQMLLSNGVFLFDVFTKHQYLGEKEYKSWEVQQDSFWYDQPHLSLEAFYRYDNESTFLKQHVIFTETEVFQYHIWEHTFSYQELINDLREAGFHSIELYGDITGARCQKGDKTIGIIARKS